MHRIVAEIESGKDPSTEDEDSDSDLKRESEAQGTDSKKDNGSIEVPEKLEETLDFVLGPVGSLKLSCRRDDRVIPTTGEFSSDPHSPAAGLANSPYKIFYNMIATTSSDPRFSAAGLVLSPYTRRGGSCGVPPPQTRGWPGRQTRTNWSRRWLLQQGESI